MRETHAIRTASAGDIDSVIAIAEALTLREGEDSDSFLVSNFSRSDYQRFLSSKHCHVLVSETGDSINGFLIGYNERYAKTLAPGTSESVIINAIGEDACFNVVKQVGIHPDHSGKGLARSLYEAFFDRVPCEYVFAAIVEKPVANTGSMKFHDAMGFIPVLQSSPPNAHYADRIINQIWAKQLQPRTYTRGVKGGDVSSDANIEYLGELYRHEDSLNWTKLGMLLTLLFAQLTAAWVLLESGANLLTSAASLMLIVLGFATLFGVKRKIDSGQKFMAAHKMALRLAESARALRDPSFLAALWHVPRQSATAGWVKIMPRLAIILWLAASLALLAKFSAWLDWYGLTF